MEQTTLTVIDRFNGEWRFLSNFAVCPWIVLDGEGYRTVEHAYQAAKTDDRPTRRVIQCAATAGAAKQLGRGIALRDGWNALRINTMRGLLLQKFSAGRSPDYLAGLLRTGDAELIEGNYCGDTFWGKCDGVGENWLGWLLMNVRETRRDK